MRAAASPRCVAHVALWTTALERLRDFYVERLGATVGPRYENPRTGFVSYFVSFGTGARLELMSRPDVVAAPPVTPHPGYAHVALSLGSREAVDAALTALGAQGVSVVSPARVTGDGYYEAVIADPDGNPVELIA